MLDFNNFFPVKAGNYHVKKKNIFCSYMQQIYQWGQADGCIKINQDFSPL